MKATRYRIMQRSKEVTMSYFFVFLPRRHFGDALHDYPLGIVTFPFLMLFPKLA